MNSFIIAFAIYSRIPMPRVKWTEENMKYAICFFPVVGVLIAAAVGFVYLIDNFFSLGKMLRTAILVAVPVIITGGIHMDGFLDTVDARSSYGEREKKLEILSDPHAGAFAIIWAIIYYILLTGFYSELSDKTIWIVAIGFVLSRALSGFSCVSFKLAKNQGMLATFSNQAQRNTVKLVTCIFSIVSVMVMVYIEPVIGCFTALTAFTVFLLYKRMAYKEFGGITGDLAGYFLQKVELAIAIAAVLCEKIIF